MDGLYRGIGAMPFCLRCQTCDENGRSKRAAGDDEGDCPGPTETV